ncbi:MAG: 4Fe-4S dicluster domain-containing protein [Deltaproteobacteria bacterium]|nr:4Fe-4S dicluster domain-containing protein [Deltaproteobacteria bacterium]
MTDKILSKDQVAAFIDSLKKEYQVFAPTEENGKIIWAEANSADGLLWEFSNTTMSPKDFFFPQSECMARFKNDPKAEGGMIMHPEPELERSRVLMNIRPCDAKAFQLLDRIFIQDEVTNDVYWRDKRDKAILVGLACNNPCPTCFCTSVGCGPHHEAGLDILLVDLGDSLLVKPISDKGKALIDDLPDAKKVDKDKAAQLKKTSEASITSGVTMDNVNKRTVLELFDLPYWDRVSESCLNCGTCTFCCPTCHCFDIQDEVKGTDGRRVRNWDTCMSWLFTVHGTGHNPRPTKKERVRQRFMHKFKYIPEKREGEIGCVGCGRCVQLCPVNIDVREVVNQMNA